MSPAASDEEDRPAGLPRSLRLTLAGLAFASCAVYVVAAAYVLGDAGFPLDDSWIHLHFARQLASGEGLAFNSGELVAASTAPLWTALLSLVFALPGGPVGWVLLLGVALHVAVIDATALLAREIGMSRGAVLLAGGLAAATGWLVWSALSGLEIPLFTLFALWGTILHLRERRAGGSAPRSLAVLGAACLARPEGLLLLALAAVDRLLRVERDGEGRLVLRAPRIGAGAGVAAAAILLAPVAAFNLATGGSPLPTTYLAKTGAAHSLVPQTSYLYVVLGIFFRAHPVPVLVAGVGLVELVRRLGGRRDRGLLPALWLFGLPIAYGALSPAGGSPLAGNFGRYFFPLFPFLAVLAALALDRLGGALGPLVTSGGRRLPLRAALLVAVLWPAVAGLVQGAGRYVQTVGNVQDSDVAVARWLDERVPADAVLAVNDIGAIKYFLPGRRVVDLAGIAHPAAIERRLQALAGGRRASEGTLRFLEEQRPDLLVVFPEWFPDLVAASSGFEIVYRVAIPDNITMGGDNIVVLSTPWTRFPLEPTLGASR